MLNLQLVDLDVSIAATDGSAYSGTIAPAGYRLRPSPVECNTSRLGWLATHPTATLPAELYTLKYDLVGMTRRRCLSLMHAGTLRDLPTILDRCSYTLMVTSQAE